MNALSLLAGTSFLSLLAMTPPPPSHTLPPGGELLLLLMNDPCRLSPAPGALDRVVLFREREACAERTQHDLRDSLRSKHLEFESVPLANAVFVWAGPGDRATICQGKNCRVATKGKFHYPRERQYVTNLPPVRPTPPPLNLGGINASTLKPITIGFSDTGFAWQHADLKRYRGVQQPSGDPHAFNWLDAFGMCAAPCDENTDGHGTGVAGEAMLSLPTDVPVNFIGCRDTLTGDDDDTYFVTCLDFLWAPFDANGNRSPALGADVVNVSGGCYPLTSTTCSVAVKNELDTLATSGVLVVASAGDIDKSGNSISSLPALNPPAIAVGGTTLEGGWYPHSPLGPPTGLCKPDVVALAMGLTVPSKSGSGYAWKEGTSYASPQVAAAAATVWAIQGGRSIGPINGAVLMAKLLRDSATGIEDRKNPCESAGRKFVPNRVFGFGSVTVGGAVKAANPTPTPTPTP